MSTLLMAFRPGELSESEIANIQALVPGMSLLHTNQEAEIEANLADIEIAVRDFPRHLIVAAPNLRWYQQWPAGADWLMEHPAAVEHPFTLTNTSGLHADNMCEHAFTLLLGVARRIRPVVAGQENGQWVNMWGLQDRYPVVELARKTMLVVGTGSIGERIAEVARAMRMRVLGVRMHPERAIDGIERMYGPGELLEALPQADIVMVAAPLTHQTLGMFGATEFAAMKPEALFINVGRGNIVRQDDLVAALQGGQIAGAGLDTFEVEPLPAGSPLWQVENTLLTTHYGGLTPHYHQRAMDIFLDNLALYAKYEPLHHVVDKVAGY